MKQFYLLALLLFTFSFVFAQKLYWTENYGSRSSLLGGQVIAGAYDNSAIYYNPGAMGFIPNSNFSISANTYGFELIKLENAIGDNMDLSSFRPNIYPSFVSGLLKIKNEKIKLGYGVYFRNNSKMNFHSIEEFNANVVGGLQSPGEEFFEGRFDASIVSSEQWISTGFAYKFSDKLSLGVNQTFNYLNINANIDVSAGTDARNGFNEQITIQNSAKLTDKINYVGMLWKIGLAYNHGAFKLGVTVTTPNQKIYGKNNVIQSQQYFNFNDYVDPISGFHVLLTQHPSYTIQKENKKLNVKYKTPWSFGFGMESEVLPKLKLMVSTELFLPIDIYTVYLDNESVTPRPNDVFDVQVDSFLFSQTGNNLIVNVGIGVEYFINEKLSLLSSFRTNFNNQKFISTSAGAINSQVWSYYHFTSGIAYRKKSNELAIGFDIGLSLKERLPQFADFTSASPNNFLVGDVENTLIARATSLNLIFGYTYFFKR